MSDTGIARVHYYPKQYLHLQDFEDEQGYHLARLRQHQIGQHSWGIVRGLELAENLDRTGLVVKPGIAVDGYGRTLILDDVHALPEGEFKQRDSNELDVWLVYARQESDHATEDGEQGSAEEFSRWQERPEVRLSVPNPANLVQPRQPAAVPQDDWDFSPTRTPSDSPLDAWPVYLGRARRTQEKPPHGAYTYSPILTGRPYAGLVGEGIKHPTGRARVQFGSDTPGTRFAVFVDDYQAEDSDDQDGGLKRAGANNLEISPEPQARLEIDQDGHITVRGQTTVEGDVIVSRGAMAFGAGKPYGNPQPWRLYRVSGDINDAGESVPEQWRLELDPDGEFSIGYFSSQENKYQDCLKVQRPPVGATDTARWTVSIEGNLHVSGLVREKVLVPPEMAVEAKTLLNQAFMAPLLGKVVEPRHVPVAGQSQIDPSEAEIQQQVTCFARQVFTTSPELAEKMVLELIKVDDPLNFAKKLILGVASTQTTLDFVCDLIQGLAKQDATGEFIRGLLNCVTELNNSDNPDG